MKKWELRLKKVMMVMRVRSIDSCSGWCVVFFRFVCLCLLGKSTVNYVMFFVCFEMNWLCFEDGWRSGSYV